MKALVHNRLVRGCYLGLAVTALAVVPVAQAGSHRTDPRIKRLDALIAKMGVTQLNTLAPILAKLSLTHGRA